MVHLLFPSSRKFRLDFNHVVSGGSLCSAAEKRYEFKWGGKTDARNILNDKIIGFL